MLLAGFLGFHFQQRQGIELAELFPIGDGCQRSKAAGPVVLDSYLTQPIAGHRISSVKLWKGGWKIYGELQSTIKCPWKSTPRNSAVEEKTKDSVLDIPYEKQKWYPITLCNEKALISPGHTGKTITRKRRLPQGQSRATSSLTFLLSWTHLSSSSL